MHLRTSLYSLLAVSAMVFMAGCTNPTPPVPVSQPEKLPVSVEAEEPPSSLSMPEESAPAIVVDEKLGRRLLFALEAQEIDAFLKENPDFIRERVGRVRFNSGDEVFDGGEHALLALYDENSLANPVQNAPRLAEFIANCQAGKPDTIVLLQPGSPVPVWIQLLSTQGDGSCLLESYMPNGSLMGSYVLSLPSETDTEWILAHEKELKIRFPKYGYEPVPFSDLSSDSSNEAILEAVLAESQQENPDGVRAVFLSDTTIDGKDCRVVEVLGENNFPLGETYAVATDLSRYYTASQVDGSWWLHARPRAAN